MEILTYLLMMMMYVVQVPCDVDERSSYWLREDDGNVSSNVSVIGEVFNVSAVHCAALCDSRRQTSNCTGIHAVDNEGQFLGASKTLPTCYLLSSKATSSSIQGQALPQGIRYRLSNCSFRKAPCQPNPCAPNSVCIEIPADCNQQDYICRECWPYETGEKCDQCVENHGGKNCNVDTTNAIYKDGYYFYIPDGPKNGSEIGDMQPNCDNSRLMCAAKGMHLIIIDSVAKNATVASLGLHEANCTNCMYQMAMRRDSISTPFHWEATDANEDPPAVTFENWYYGQPSSDTDDYLYTAFMPNIHYQWLDINCNFFAYYACEYHLTAEDERRRQH